MSDLGVSISQARSDLAATLAAIEEKLNVPKRFAALTGQAKKSYRADSRPWLLAGAAAVAVIGGTITWAIVAGGNGRR